MPQALAAAEVSDELTAAAAGLQARVDATTEEAARFSAALERYRSLTRSGR